MPYRDSFCGGNKLASVEDLGDFLFVLLDGVSLVNKMYIFEKLLKRYYGLKSVKTTESSIIFNYNYAIDVKVKAIIKFREFTGKIVLTLGN